jgi:hypothetical protein
VKLSALLILAIALVSSAQQYTRGVGVYPGDPKEYTGPALQVDTGTYRNLALHRPAYESSAYDYNLTAQLVTDGIKDEDTPQWIVTSTSDEGVLAKNEREVFLDGNVVSSIEVSGDNPWVQFDINGDGEPHETDKLDLYLRKIYSPLPTAGWLYIVSGSDDRVTWKELGRSGGTEWPDRKDSGPSFKQSITLTAPAHCRSYRIQMSAGGVRTWGVAEVILFDKNHEVRVAGPKHFRSA